MALPRVSMVDFLIQKGYLKKEQLDEANKVKDQSKSADIGKVLVELGMVGEREVLMAKAQEMGYAFVDLDRVNVESSAINVVREQIVKNNNVLPVKKQDNTLYVAMSNPNNLHAIDAVSLASGCRVVPVLAVPGAIETRSRSITGAPARQTQPHPRTEPPQLALPQTRISTPISAVRSPKPVSNKAKPIRRSRTMATPKRWPSRLRSSSLRML
jgi:type IV pilus assembly protein PilB